jgi:FtsZ-binding cell division protein ZapB
MPKEFNKDEIVLEHKGDIDIELKYHQFQIDELKQSKDNGSLKDEIGELKEKVESLTSFIESETDEIGELKEKVESLTSFIESETGEISKLFSEVEKLKSIKTISSKKKKE